MKTYIFNGRIYPERTYVSISPISLDITAIEAGIKGKMTISVDVAQISVIFDSTDIVSDIFTLKNYVEFTVRSVVDSYGYLSGRGYDVEIISFSSLEGEQIVFSIGELELEKCTGERPLKLSEILSLFDKAPSIPHAFANLREAIRSPHVSGLFCFLAIESIRQHFLKGEDNDKNRESSWEIFGESINISESYVAHIKEFAVSQRHGKPMYMSGESRADMLLRTWKIVDRFLVYVDRKFKSLSEPEFILLK